MSQRWWETNFKSVYHVGTKIIIVQQQMKHWNTDKGIWHTLLILPVVTKWRHTISSIFQTEISFGSGTDPGTSSAAET